MSVTMIEAVCKFIQFLCSDYIVRIFPGTFQSAFRIDMILCTSTLCIPYNLMFCFYRLQGTSSRWSSLSRHWNFSQYLPHSRSLSKPSVCARIGLPLTRLVHQQSHDQIYNHFDHVVWPPQLPSQLPPSCAIFIVIIAIISIIINSINNLLSIILTRCDGAPSQPPPGKPCPSCAWVWPRAVASLATVFFQL